MQKNWLISYLKGRKRIVVIENETSAAKEILKGLPKGSLLGPTLFPIYINDIISSGTILCTV